MTAVNNLWEQSSNMPSLADRLRSCGRSIQDWSRKEFGNIQRHIKMLMSKNENLKDGQRTEHSSDEEVKTYNELDECEIASTTLN